MSIWMERENAIINSIMSGNNACNALQKLVAQALAGDAKPLDDFLRCKVRGTLKVCADEAAQKDRDLRAALADAENKRFALESVVSNMRIDNPLVLDAVRKALPGRL